MTKLRHKKTYVQFCTSLYKIELIISENCPSSSHEILVDRKYSTLVPVNDANALAKAMTEALMNPPDAEFLKQRAADFSAEKIAQQYLDVMFPHDH